MKLTPKDLTPENYHELKNKLGIISNSDLKKFIDNPAQFKYEVIDKNRVWEDKPAYWIGSRVDDVLTGDGYVFEDLYSPKVLKKDNPELFELNNQYKETKEKEVVAKGKFDMVQGLCKSAYKNEFFNKYCKPSIKQKILTMPYKLSHGFKMLGGMLDYLYIDGKNAIIIDLKSAMKFMPIQKFDESLDDYKARCANVYLWRCRNYGYINQAGMYDRLVKYNYPEVKNIKFIHFVIEKIIDEFPISIIPFSRKTIDEGWDNIESTLNRLNSTIVFNPKYKKGERVTFDKINNCLII